MLYRTLFKLAKPAFKAGKFGLKTAFGGGIGRMALGAGIGAAYQVVASQSNDSTNYATDIARGAILGGGMGAVSRSLFPKVAVKNGIPQFSGKTIWSLPFTKIGKAISGPAMKTAGIAGRLGTNIGIGALKYPTVATLGVAGLYGATHLGSGSPALQGRVSGNFNNESEAFDELDHGYAPSYEMYSGSMANKRFQNSTVGLVQSLHRGRH